MLIIMSPVCSLKLSSPISLENFFYVREEPARLEAARVSSYSSGPPPTCFALI